MRITYLAAVTVGLALVTASCGGDDDTSDATVATVAPTTTVAPDETSDDMTEEMSDDMTEEMSEEMSEDVAPATTEPTTVSTDEMSNDAAGDVPQAILSLSPTATEMLYAIDAGDQVLAVDDFSNYPPEAADKMQGISAFEPNVEAIAGLEPDLVITDGTNPSLLEQLDTLGIKHWEGLAATSFDDVYTQIEQLGAVTGNIAEAAMLVGNMQTDVEAVKADLPQLDEPLSYYHELDDTYFSVTSDTFIGAVYTEIGLVNIADDAGLDAPYPQLNAEYIIDQNPDLIFLADAKYYGITADSVAERPGWETIAAVQNGGVIEMDDDIASRWGPRIVEYLQLAGDAVANAPVSEPAG